MSVKHLTTPISDEDILDLKIGDTVYLTGRLVTARDDVHGRVIKQHRELPVDLDRMAIFHAGPIMKEREDEPGRYDVISIGPTTSMRMEQNEKEFLAETGVKLVIGKGGMGPKTEEGCRESIAAHAVFPGGCAVLAADCVEEVESLEWPELGMPEAMWVMRVKDFGPCIISIDAQGNNLFGNNRKQFEERKEEALAALCGHLPEIS